MTAVRPAAHWHFQNLNKRTMKNTKNSALPQAEGLLKNLKEYLSGKDGFIWLAALKLFVRRQPTWTSPYTWPVWQVIRNGIHKSFESFEEACKRLNVQMNEDVFATIKKFTFRNITEHDIKLVLATILDLGFSPYEKPSYEKIVRKAKQKGLRLCTPFDGLVLRTSCTLEENSSPISNERHLVIMSKPIGRGLIDNGNLLFLSQWQGKLFISLTNEVSREIFDKDSKLIFRID